MAFPRTTSAVSACERATGGGVHPARSVSGLATEQRAGDRGGAGEGGAIQNKGAGGMAELRESGGSANTGPMAAVCTRLVGVLPTGRKSPTDLPAGGLDTPAYPEMLLVAVA